MPVHRIQAPNGSIYKFEAPEGASDADLFGFTEQLMQEDEAHKAKTGALRAAKSGWYDTKEATWRALGMKDWEAEARKAREAVGYEPTTEEDVSRRGAGAWLTKNISEPIGGMVGSFAAPMAAAAGITAALPQSVAGAGIASLAGAASLAARAAPFIPMEVGHNLQRQEEQGQSPDALKAWAAGIAQGALDVVGVPIRGPLRATAMETAKKLAPEVAAGRMTADAAKQAVGDKLLSMSAAKQYGSAMAQNAAQAGSMMVGNEALRRAQAGQDIASPEAGEQYLESLKTAGTLAPIFGGMHGMKERSAALKAIDTAGTEHAETAARLMAEQRAKEQSDRQAIDDQWVKDQTAALMESYSGMTAEQLQNEIVRTKRGMKSKAMKANPELTQWVESMKALLEAQKAKEAELATTEQAAAQDRIQAQKDAFDAQLAGDMSWGELEHQRQLVLHWPKNDPLREHALAKLDAAKSAVHTSEMQGYTEQKAAEQANAELAKKSVFSEPELPPVMSREDMLKSMESLKPPPTVPTEVPKAADVLSPMQATAKAARDARKMVQESVPVESPPPFQETPTAEAPTATPTPAPIVKTAPVSIVENGRVVNTETARATKSAPAQARAAAAQEIGRQETLAGQLAAAEAGRPSRGAEAEPAPVETVAPARRVQQVAPLPPEVPSRAPAVQQEVTATSEGLAARIEAEREAGASDARIAALERRLELLQKAEAKAKVPKAAADLRAAAKELEAEGMAADRAGREGFDETLEVDVNAPKEGEVVSKPVVAAPVEAAAPEAAPVQAAPSVMRPLHETAVAQLEKGNLGKALTAIAKHGSDEIVRAVAKRVSSLVDATRLFVVDNLAHPTSKEEMAGATAPMGDRVWLHKSKGMTEETVLHEAVHAAAERAINQYKADKTQLTPAERKAVEHLGVLQKEAVKAKLSLSEAAKKDVSEFVAEALSNLKLQHEMSQRVWERKSLWDMFKRAMLQLIGVQEPKNMRDAAIAAADTIFRPVEAPKFEKGKAPRELPTNVRPQFAQDAQQMAAATRSMGTGEKHRIRNSDRMIALLNPEGVSRTTAVRTAMVDKLAAVVERMAASHRGEKVAAQARQAVDWAKMASEYLLRGDLQYNRSLGMYEVVGDGSRAPAKVFELLKQQAEQAGMPLQEYSRTASRVLELNYLHNIRERNRQGLSDVAYDKKLDPLIDQAKQVYDRNPEYQELTKRMNDARFEMVDQLVQTGRLDAHTGKQWKDNIFYVPMDRLGDLMEKFSNKKQIKAGGLGTMAEFKKLVGSETREVGNVFENYVNTMSWLMQQVLKQDANNAMMRELKAVGAAKRSHGSEPYTVTLYENGQKHTYALPSKYDVQAFTDAPVNFGGWKRVLSDLSQTARITVTAMPPFALKQNIKDSFDAAIKSGVKSPTAVFTKTLVNFWPLALMEVVPSLKNSKPFQKWVDMSRRMESLGLTGQIDWQRMDPADSLLKNIGMRERKALGSKTLGALLHKAEGISHASDLAARMAIYEQTLHETANAGMPRGDERLAAVRAREYINFSRAGSHEAVTFLRHTVPFFNVRLQSMDLLYRAATGKDNTMGLSKDQARKIFVARVGELAAFSLAYALMKSDDPVYQGTDQDVKDKNWLLGEVGGTPVRIPIQSEFAVLFKAPAERMVDYLRREGTPEEQKAMTALGSYLRALFAGTIGETPPIPVALRAPLESASNFSFTTLRKLEGPHQAGMLPYARVNENTTAFAKGVAEFAHQHGVEGISPIMVDNIINNQFGLLGPSLNTMATYVFKPDAPELPIYKLPFLSDYTYTPAPKQYLNEFYDLRERVVQAHNTYNDIAKRNPDELPEFIEKHRGELALYSTVNTMLKQLQKTRAAREFFMTSAAASSSMTPAQRTEAVENLKKQEAEMAKWVRSVEKELGLN